MLITMGALQYAVVAYVTGALARFIEELRADVYPGYSYLLPHLTILPPRDLKGNELAALHNLESLCRDVAPFEVVLGKAESFLPTTPTVFIQVEHAAYKMRELHDRLNSGGLACDEQWPYMPHMTIVKMPDAAQAEHVLRIARERWASYTGTHCVTVEQLTFVREGENHRWIDLAPVPLGRTMASRLSC